MNFKDISVKCCAKITVSMLESPGIPEEVVYYHGDLPLELCVRWRWYFEYLAALVKVANPKRRVELYCGRQYLPLGKEYIEYKTKTLLAGKRRQLTKLANQVDDDLFGFTSEAREKKRQRIQTEIDELESGVFKYYVPPVYFNKLKKWLHCRSADEAIGDYLHGGGDGCRLKVVRQSVK